MENPIWKISVALFTYSCLIREGRTNVQVNKFEHCDRNADYSAKFNVRLTVKEQKQYVDGSVMLKSDLDNTLISNISVELLTGGQYMHILSLSEKKSCDALHKFLGEFIYDVERKAQIIPGLCPIAKGKYRLHNVSLDYQKITVLANFPVGNLRITDVVFGTNNRIYTCLIAEGENHGYF